MNHTARLSRLALLALLAAPLACSHFAARAPSKAPDAAASTPRTSASGPPSAAAKTPSGALSSAPQFNSSSLVAPSVVGPGRLAIFPIKPIELRNLPALVSAHYVGWCSSGTCDVWARTGEYLGEVPENGGKPAGAAESWRRLGDTLSTASPSGLLALVHEEAKGWQLRSRETRRPVALPMDCDAAHTVWSPDESMVAVLCGRQLVAFDTRTSRRAGNFMLPEEMPTDRVQMVWSTEVRLGFSDFDRMTLVHWVPGRTAKIDSRDHASIGFDPITRETWLSIRTEDGADHLETQAPAPGVAASKIQYLPKPILQVVDGIAAPAVIVVEWNASGTAFVRKKNEWRTWHFSVVNLSGEAPSATISEYDGSNYLSDLRMLAQPTPRGDRAVVIVLDLFDRSAAKGWLLVGAEQRPLRVSALAAPAADGEEAAIDASDPELFVDEERAIVLMEGRLFVVPLDGRSAGRWMSAGEQAAWTRPVTTNRFSTTDGEVFTRLSDGTILSRSRPCWWPHGWPEPPAEFSVRVGPVFGGKLLSEETVKRLFCDTSLAQRFFRGASMPPRPPASITEQDAK